MLPSVNGRKNLLSDLLRLNVLISSDVFEVEQFKLLLNAVLDKQSDNIIWDQLYATVRDSTPPPSALPVLDQTPFLHTTSSLAHNAGVNSGLFGRIVHLRFRGVGPAVPDVVHDRIVKQIRALRHDSDVFRQPTKSFRGNLVCQLHCQQLTRPFPVS
ncbi:hypothetical protein BDW66DRAFT_9354 [Aspergillus desertorum]